MDARQAVHHCTAQLPVSPKVPISLEECLRALITSI